MAKNSKLSKKNTQSEMKTDGKMMMSANSISVNSRAGARKPVTKTTNSGTILTHTETYGVNITGSSAFNTFSVFAVQPGIATYSKGSPLGQWLPQIAQNFDNYEILSLKFTFRSACSTLEPGLIIMGYEPNPEGTLPTSYQELRNMYSVDGSVHANLTFDVSKLVRKNLLIRKRAVINLPSYDAGKIYVATIGCTDLAKLGFVDVTYSVRLFNPQSQNSSTDVIPVTSTPISPVQLYQCTAVSSATINVVSASTDVTSIFLNGAKTVAGASLFTDGAFASPALNQDYNGMKFVDSATNRYQWKCNTSGRYRLDFNLNVDFEDLKLFCALPFIRDVASSWTVASYQVYSIVDGTATGYLPCTPIGHRGFTGVVTGDPNPATDMPLRGSFEFTIVANQFITLGLGFQTYNAVSTTTANVKFASGRGNPANFCFTYLGGIVEIG